MKRIALLFFSLSLEGMHIIKIASERSLQIANVQCTFSADTIVQYNPGFKAPIDVPYFFKKKYFFCPHCTIAPGILKKSDAYSNTYWAVVLKVVSMPCPGLLIVCAYDPREVSFSWIRDSIHSTYTFYFTYTALQMIIPSHNDQPQYYAFNKDLPKFMPMCYI